MTDTTKATVDGLMELVIGTPEEEAMIRAYATRLAHQGEPVAPNVQIVTNEHYEIEAYITVMQPAEYHVSAERDEEFQDWYIRVTAPNGGRDYDGYWTNSGNKNADEVIQEAIRGACLPSPITSSRPAGGERGCNRNCGPFAASS